MARMEIWHNPRCTKSRQTKALLDEAGASYDERRYLDDPPSEERLREVLAALGIPAIKLVRKPDAKKLGLGVTDMDEEELVAAMAANPAIIERPVVITADGRAVIGRPPERVTELLDQ